jgi:hypothetical protein
MIENIHHAMVKPIAVYVPLVIQKTPRYLKCPLVDTRFSKYPIAPTEEAIATGIPLVW